MQKEENAAMIMIQGTSSHAGKSTVATALCRIFSQKNFKTAPFKSWNMSLNSTVTKSGGEIGIAQAVQAQAAGVEAEVEMQPILVKPEGEGKSQVIIKGEPLLKKNRTLKKDYYHKGLKVIGAGSPVEINVKDKDLANMKIAKLNNTPVILVADIERGGVFASIVGTMELLSAEERELVAGFIINKLHGDSSVLKSGIDYLEKRYGIPVLGVLPYIHNSYLPEEDAVALSEVKVKGENNFKDKLKICVLKLPHISNFTDFAALESDSRVILNYSLKKSIIKEADVIIIPGTKNTISDLKYLKDNNIDKLLTEMVKENKKIIGICGGYQMLGEKLKDPQGVEGKRRSVSGIGLLALETIFTKKKSTNLVEASVLTNKGIFEELKGEKVEAYEIHLGYSKIKANELDSTVSIFKVIKRSGEKVDERDGFINAEKNVWGSYFHGLFNNDMFREKFITMLLNKKENHIESYEEKINNSFNRLAQLFEENIDMEKLREVIFR